MKTINISLFLVLILTFSCKMIKTEDKITRVVSPSFPGLTLKGDQILSSGVGSGTFKDPGATSYDSVTKISSDIQPLVNSVDLTVPGFYGVQYEAKNSYGYRTNKNRLVLVTSVSESQDISGIYKRTNGQTVMLTKKGTGLYTIDNIGGVPSNPDYVFDVYLGVPTDSTIQAPAQNNPLGGNISISGGQLTINGPNVKFSYIVQGAGFGTSRRTFIKQ